MAVTSCETLDTLETTYKGDTSPILQPRPTVLDDGVVLDADWTCSIAADYEDGTEAVAETPVTDKTADNLRFIAALTPTQTGAIVIPSGLECINIILKLVVINTTLIPPFQKTVRYTLPIHV